MGMRENWSRRELLRAAGIGGVGALLNVSGTGSEGRAAEPASPAAGNEAGEQETIQEAPRRTPVAMECDVCVIGGSATGVFAAVAAARLGAKVALVELEGFFGGVATASLVNIWHSFYDLHRENQIISGLTEEVIDRLRRVDAVSEHFRSARGDGSNHFEFHPEVLKLELDHLVIEAGIRPFLHTMFVSPVVEEGTQLRVHIRVVLPGGRH